MTKDALLEMERVIYKQLESLMAAGVPTDDLLTEMMAASAELHAQLEQEQPRGP